MLCAPLREISWLSRGKNSCRLHEPCRLQFLQKLLQKVEAGSTFRAAKKIKKFKSREGMSNVKNARATFNIFFRETSWCDTTFTCFITHKKTFKTVPKIDQSMTKKKIATAYLTIILYKSKSLKIIF
jgi:hypothetical protein